MKLFKKCGISSAMDGTEDDEIYWDEESDSQEVTGKTDVEENDTSDIERDEEFSVFYDV